MCFPKNTTLEEEVISTPLVYTPYGVNNAPISMIDLLEQIHTKELILLKIDYL
jgi:hypothetical protein